MAQRDTGTEGGVDPERAARITLEPYRHDVRITVGGVEVAQTRDGLLFRDGYAPDIYVPARDVRRAVLRPSGRTQYSPYKDGEAAFFDAEAEGQRIADVAWCYPEPAAWGELAGHFAFDFDKVRIEVDGRPVRGHVRDPHKVISVRDLGRRLTLELGGRVVAETDRALVLEETGLPPRYYLPREDVDAACLQPSDRRTVCTYKGEADYFHLSAGGQRHENAVWTYAAPWTDFAADIGRIAGRLGTYASLFDRVLLDGEPQAGAEGDGGTDRAMIASPTIDGVLRDGAGGAR